MRTICYSSEVSFHLLLIAGYKVYNTDWKKVESLVPAKSAGQIKDHAAQFLEEVAKLGHDMHDSKKIREFVCSKSNDYLASITFGAEAEDPHGEDEKLPTKQKCLDPESNNFRGESGQQRRDSSSEAARRPDHNALLPPNMKPRQLPTQAFVISDTLKKMTGEMLVLLQRLSTDMNGRRGELASDQHVSGYWNYIYSSAIYLQQMINDVTVAHNSALAANQSQPVASRRTPEPAGMGGKATGE